MNRLLLLLSFIGLFLATVACQPAAKPVEAAPPEEKSLPIEAAAVERGDIRQVVEYAGTLQPLREVMIVPRVSGQVETLLVAEGDQVRAGQPIARIEADIYALQLDQAEAALLNAKLNLAKMREGSRPEEIAAAKTARDIAEAALVDARHIDDDERTTAAANLADAQTALRLAQAEYDKIAWAGQVDQMPQALALEQATNAYQTALAAYNLQTNPTASQLAPLEAQLVNAELNLTLALEPFRPLDFEIGRANIQQAEAAVELAKLQLEYTTLKAPFDGVIAELYLDPGDMVGPQVPVAMIVSTELEAALHIEENRLGQLYKGQPAGLRVSAYPEREFPAVVSNIQTGRPNSKPRPVILTVISHVCNINSFGKRAIPLAVARLKVAANNWSQCG